MSAARRLAVLGPLARRGSSARIDAVRPAVELFSGVDRVRRRVDYWTEFRGMRSEHLEDYAPVLQRAEALCAEYGTCMIDRSDRGSGLLRASLG